MYVEVYVAASSYPPFNFCGAAFYNLDEMMGFCYKIRLKLCCSDSVGLLLFDSRKCTKQQKKVSKQFDTLLKIVVVTLVTCCDLLRNPREFQLSINTTGQISIARKVIWPFLSLPAFWLPTAGHTGDKDKPDTIFVQS